MLDCIEKIFIFSEIELENEISREESLSATENEHQQNFLG